MEQNEIIQAVQSATADVFSTMLGLELEPRPTDLDKGCPSVSDGVMAFVGVTGPWVGTGIVSCSAAFACKLCATFLMSEAETVNEEVLDAVGEIANMVIGNFKNAAEAVVGPLGLTVPTVIYGRNFTSKSLRNNEWHLLPFKCGEDELTIRIWFAPATQPTVSKHSNVYVHTF